jgi:predicted HNH restriction endonuclease
MIRYVLIEAFCDPRAVNYAGYTDKAVRRKIESGVWLEGEVWIKGPDGHILIDLRGYNKWVRSTNAGSSTDPTASESASTGEGAGVVRRFASSRT